MSTSAKTPRRAKPKVRPPKGAPQELHPEDFRQAARHLLHLVMERERLAMFQAQPALMQEERTPEDDSAEWFWQCLDTDTRLRNVAKLLLYDQTERRQLRSAIRVLAHFDDLLDAAKKLRSAKDASSPEGHKAFGERVEAVLTSAELPMSKKFLAALLERDVKGPKERSRALQAFKALMPVIGMTQHTLDRIRSVIRGGKGAGRIKTLAEAEMAMQDMEPRSVDVVRFVINVELKDQQGLRDHLLLAVDEAVTAFCERHPPRRVAPQK